MKEKKVKSLSHVQLFPAPWTVAYQAPLSMGFSRQEYWSGLPFRAQNTMRVLLAFSDSQEKCCCISEPEVFPFIACSHISVLISMNSSNV